MEDSSKDIAPLIKMVDEKIEKYINKNMKEYDLTFSQLRIVMFLYQSNITVYCLKELEKNFNVSQQTMAGLIKRLELKGFVRSFNELKDKRVKKVELTEKGKEIGEKIEQKRIETKNWIFSSLTNEEKELLYNLIEKIYNSIK